MIFSKRSIYIKTPIHEEDELAKRLTAQGKNVIKLNRGDPAEYFKTPKYIIDAYIAALKAGKTGYGESLGVKELRTAVANHYGKRCGIGTTPEDVVVTQGVSEAFGFINSMLIDEGDRAVVFAPSYSQYLPNLYLYGGVPITEPYHEEKGWSLDTDSLRKNVKKSFESGKKIKYLILANPNNPTGTVHSRKTLSDIAEIAKDYNILLISDEIYDEIVYNGGKFTSMCDVSKGIPHIILDGASKDYDATGFRIGLMIIPEHDKESTEMKEKLLDCCKTRLSANTPAQYAVAEGFNNVAEHKKAVAEMVSEISDRVNFLSKRINESEYMHTVVPNASFYIFPQLNMDKLDLDGDAEFVRKLLEEESVQITRGSGFGTKDHVRIVSLAPKETLELAVEKMDRFCKRHKK